MASTPIHILFFPSKAFIIVNQTQYKLDPIPCCFNYYKIQPLQTKKKKYSYFHCCFNSKTKLLNNWTISETFPQTSYVHIFDKSKKQSNPN